MICSLRLQFIVYRRNRAKKICQFLSAVDLGYGKFVLTIRVPTGIFVGSGNALSLHGHSSYISNRFFACVLILCYLPKTICSAAAEQTNTLAHWHISNPPRRKHINLSEQSEDMGITIGTLAHWHISTLTNYNNNPSASSSKMGYTNRCGCLSEDRGAWKWTLECPVGRS